MSAPPQRIGFAHTADVPWDAAGDGIRRQILAHTEDLMMVRVEFDAGAVGAVHHHPHRQATYVAAGIFDVLLDGETRTLGPGDGFLAAAAVPHGVRALTSGTLVDVFTPMRADFL